MSTEVREEIAAAGGSGDGDGLDPPATVSGEIRPPAGAPEAPEKKETGPEWLADADEDTRKLATSKGWDKDPRGALTSYAEAEKEITRGRQREAELERQLADARGGGQRTQGNDEPSIEQFLDSLADAYENGDIGTKELVRNLFGAGVAAAQAEADSRVSQRIDPVERRQTADIMDRTAAEIARTYPDFVELSDQVLEMIEQNPGKYGDAEGMWAAYGLVKSRQQVKDAAESRAANRTETLDGGGRNGDAGADASASIRKQLRDIRTPLNDGL